MRERGWPKRKGCNSVPPKMACCSSFDLCLGHFRSCLNGITSQFESQDHSLSLHTKPPLFLRGTISHRNKEKERQAIVSLALPQEHSNFIAHCSAFSPVAIAATIVVLHHHHHHPIMRLNTQRTDEMRWGKKGERGGGPLTHAAASPQCHHPPAPDDIHTATALPETAGCPR